MVVVRGDCALVASVSGASRGRSTQGRMRRRRYTQRVATVIHAAAVWLQIGTGAVGRLSL